MLASIKVVALTGLLGAVGGGGIGSGTPGADPAWAKYTEAHNRVVGRAMTHHECSHSGFDAGTVPASALIQTDAGIVRQVSFEVGWDVYNGRRPGTLIAVCLAHSGG
jgi:hypothetical protein